MRNQLGIDLGAAVLSVSARGEGVILHEPSVAAKDRHTGQYVAFGRAARELLDARSGQHMAVAPFRENLRSGAYTPQTIAYLLRSSSCIGKNRLLLGIPCHWNEHQEGALIELAGQAGADECYLVYTPVAAHIGDGGDFTRARCLLEIGAARTNFLIVGGGIIRYRETVSVAGDAFNTAIATYLEKQYSMHISTGAAEQIKRRIGSVWTGGERMSVDVVGKHIDTGETIKKRIWSDEILIAFEEPMTAILEIVCRGLHKLPAEYIKDVLEDGVLMYGGGSRLRGMQQMIEGITRVKVTARADDDRRLVALGMEKILCRLPEQMHLPVGNISRNCVKMYTTLHT